MRRFALALVVVLAAACASDQALLDAGESAFESHRAAYARYCDGGDSTTPECMRYGDALNSLDDALKDAEAGADGKLPGTIRERVKKATSALEKAAVP